MKTTTRFLVMIGASISAATAFTAPASAAAPAAPASTVSQVQVRDWDDDDDDVVGYFDTRRECDRVGRFGERRDRWEDYDCTLIRWGRHRGDWELSVERDWHGGPWGGHHGGGHGGGHH
jgi:hypothetical protein